ncbi:MAG TPA: ATP-binding protein [Opitutaceae bacterium]
MNLRTRAWNFVLVATGGLLAVVLVVGGWLFNHGYRAIEETDAVRQGARARATLEVEIEDLERTTRDYAEWLDTAAYAQGRLPRYPQENWTASALANVRVDLSLVFRADGTAVGGAELAPGGESVRAAQPAQFAAFTSEVARVLADPTGYVRVHGAKLLGGELALFACSPVMVPGRGEPVQGAMLNVRRVDAAFLARVRPILGWPVAMHLEEAGAAAMEFAPTEEADVLYAVQSADRVAVRVRLRGPDGAPVAWMQLDLDRPIHRRAVWTLWAFAGVIALSGLVFGTITQGLLRRLVVTRLEALYKALSRVRATNDLTVRLPVSGSDEIAELGHSLNGMLAALERGRRERERAQQERDALQDQLARAQRMEVVGEIARGIAHDFNNCLTVIAGWIGVVREGLPERDENRELLSHALASTDHAVDVVRQLLLYSRQSAPVLSRVPLRDAIDGSVKLLRSTVPKGVTIDVQTSVTEDGVLGDRTQLVQILVNLVKNAADATGEGGQITLSLEAVRLPDPACVGAEGLPPRDYLRLSVRDNGPGIPPDIRPRIFEPFFTTKPSGRGTGLGLAVVNSVVTRHGGAVGLESAPGEGTSFYVYLPREAAGEAGEETASEPPPGVTGVRILVAEDDPQVAQLVAAMIRRQGGHVVTQPDGMTAWQAFQKEDPPFDLVLTDLNMPRMSGVQLGERIFDSARPVPVVLMSAYAATLDAEKLKRVGFSAVLGKPVAASNLLSALHRARSQVVRRNGDEPRSLL